MKTVGIISAALLVASAITVASAQTNSGSALENKGNTGWTGGSQDQPSQSGQSGNQAKPAETTGQNPKVVVHDDALAKDQPLMASGEDLKGPPQRFAPSKTPE